MSTNHYFHLPHGLHPFDSGILSQTTVATGIIDVVTFVNYRVFATKQTGEMRKHCIISAKAPSLLTEIRTGNFLFVALYISGKKHLRSKIEQNVVVSITSYANHSQMSEGTCIDIAIDSASEVSCSAV